MRLVDHHQIEVPRPEPLLAALHLVDQPHHRLVRADVDTAFLVALAHQVHGRTGRQVPFEGIPGLDHKRVAVGQKKHPLHPVGALQHIAQGNHGPCLARACGHHQQSLALLPIQRSSNLPNCALLIIAPHNLRVRRNRIERLARGAAVDGQLQLVAGIEALHGSRRIKRVIPQPMVVTVRVEDHRALAKLPLQPIGIEFGLLLAFPGVALGALGFHHGQRLPVLTPQDVIHKAFAGCVRHPLHGKLAVPLLVERPTCFFQQQVDEGVAGLGLVVIVGVGSGFIRSLGGGYLGAQPLNLIVQRGLVLE